MYKFTKAMNVLIAFDKFKDSLNAHEACEIAAKEIAALHPEWNLDTAPLSDGGDGFCKILTESRQGRLFKETVHGPRFEKVEALFGTVKLERLEPDLRKWLKVPPEGEISIIEMAQSSGLHHLAQEERDLWRTSTLGAGELIARAIELKSKAILIGVGGSATHDLGLGTLEALGLQFISTKDKPINHLTPLGWDEVAHMGGSIPTNLPPIRIACDVKNSLLGPDGAAAIYGPQKGMKPEDWSKIEKHSEHMAKMLCQYTETDESVIHEEGSGAAGGIAFGLRTALGAELVAGFDLVLQWLQLEKKLAKADLIITGEGRFDRSSLQGKGPGTLIEKAIIDNKKILIFAGLLSDDLNTHLPQSFGKENLIQITPDNCPLEQALRDGRENLARAILKTVD